MKHSDDTVGFITFDLLKFELKPKDIAESEIKIVVERA
jgi:hypothetical protein